MLIFSNPCPVFDNGHFSRLPHLRLIEPSIKLKKLCLNNCSFSGLIIYKVNRPFTILSDVVKSYTASLVGFQRKKNEQWIEMNDTKFVPAVLLP